MFGKNSIQGVETWAHSLRVQSIFYTLQGEGPFSGCPAVFIRVAGCNLACHFCDTDFESGLHNVMSLAHIIKNVDDCIRVAADDGLHGQGRKLVVITGGEPMRQQITQLVLDLLSSGTEHVQIETAGTLWPEGFEEAMKTGKVTLVCSPKTPKIHPKIHDHCFHWKYVVANGEIDLEDGLPCAGTQSKTKDKLQRIFRPSDLYSDLNTVWISPRDDSPLMHIPGEVRSPDRHNMQAAIQSCLHFGYRLSLQIHKLCGLE